MARKETVHVEGLRELQRAWARAGKDVAKDMKGRLLVVAEPVRSEAETNASREIRNIGSRWGRMRVGMTRSTGVYVAPKTRGTRDSSKKRPNLATLLLLKAMLPALQANKSRVMREMDRFMGDVARDWKRGRYGG